MHHFISTSVALIYGWGGRYFAVVMYLGLFFGRPNPVLPPPPPSEEFLQEPEMTEITFPVLTEHSQILTRQSSITVTPSAVSELGGLDVWVQFITIPFLWSANALWVNGIIFLYYLLVKREPALAVFPEWRASLNKYAKYHLTEWLSPESLCT